MRCQKIFDILNRKHEKSYLTHRDFVSQSFLLWTHSESNRELPAYRCFITKLWTLGRRFEYIGTPLLQVVLPCASVHVVSLPTDDTFLFTILWIVRALYLLLHLIVFSLQVSVAHPEGFEPPTFGFGDRRSTN